MGYQPHAAIGNSQETMGARLAPSSTLSLRGGGGGGRTQASDENTTLRMECLKECLEILFDQLPEGAQPAALAASASHHSMLLQAYMHVRDSTPRGANLGEQPLTLLAHSADEEERKGAEAAGRAAEIPIVALGSLEDAPFTKATLESLAGGAVRVNVAGSGAGMQSQGYLAALHSRWPGADSSTYEMFHCGGDAVKEVPLQRWDTTSDLPPAASFGAFLPNAEKFDNTFFSVSPTESNDMDPQQRLLLEMGYTSLHTTSERRSSLRGECMGVFLGIMNTDFGLMASGRNSVYAATGGTISIAAGRLSFALGTQGPCASYDTACSAGLVALHGGLSAQRCGECSTGLVVAVSLMLAPTSHIMYARANMLSPDGRCKTFDKRANGYARGESVSAGYLLDRPVVSSVKYLGRWVARPRS